MNFISQVEEAILNIKNRRLLRQLIIKNLQKLNFINNVSTHTNFKDEPVIVAIKKQKENTLPTSITITILKDSIEFSKISVKKEEEGKGYSTKMIEAVLNALKTLKLEKSKIYLSNPYNDKFWEHIKSKYSGFNWRF